VVVATSDWIIIELSDTVENIGYDDIKNALLNAFGESIEYFIPIHHEMVGSYSSTSVLMEGYAFVKDSDYVRDHILNLRDQRIFSKVLCNKGRYQTLNSHEIAGLKHKLKNSLKKKLASGTRARITEGVFKNLIGEVIGVEDGGKRIIVRIKRISREIIAPVPATALQKIEDTTDEL
jgi:transcription antitermination factor NusG